jgi:CheY-like chemotaxis protein
MPQHLDNSLPDLVASPQTFLRNVPFLRRKAQYSINEVRQHDPSRQAQKASGIARHPLSIHCRSRAADGRNALFQTLKASIFLVSLSFNIYRIIILFEAKHFLSRTPPRCEVVMRAIQSQATLHPVILVVEDLDSLRHTFQEILEGADFFVLPASNANEALELAASCTSPIHLLITKLHPPGMPGPDLAVILRKHSPEMSVLYSCANPLAALEVPDPAEVVSSMLPRPFSRATLLSRINTLLAPHV